MLVGPTLIALAALAGGLAAAAIREAVRGAPRLAGWLAGAVRPLARAGREGYAPSAVERRRLGAVGSLAILVAVTALAGPGPLALLGGAGPASAAWLVARRRERYRRAVERSIPEIATAIADAVSGGRSVRSALSGAGASLEGPPAAELGRVGAELELGVPTAEALASLRSRVGSTRLDGLVAALLSQQGAGGDLAGLMRRVAAAAAERDRVAEAARAATTQARFTGLLVVALPAGAGLFAELLQPGFVGRVLSDPAATTMLALAGCLQLAGFALIRRFGGAPE
jgi:tight adherence protein B